MEELVTKENFEEKLIESAEQALEIAKGDEILTEVTSIAKEEEKSGVKVEMPTAEELVARASTSLINTLQTLNILFPKLSGRGKSRVLNSILDLPKDGIPVRLRGDEEKMCFALGQRAISDRFIILQHHIREEFLKQQQEKLESNEETQEDSDE